MIFAVLNVTGDLSAGSIAIVASILGTAIGLGIKIGTLQTLVKGHAITLTAHSDRLDRYENTLIKVGGDLQRMIGRIEATQDRIDRSTGTRAGEGGGL